MNDRRSRKSMALHAAENGLASKIQPPSHTAYLQNEGSFNNVSLTFQTVKYKNSKYVFSP